MKNAETKLNRLLAASRVESAERVDLGANSAHATKPMPAHLKTRVLAHWRSGAEELASLWLSLFFRRALACAAIIMAASVTWAVVTDEPDDEVTLANYELRAELLP